MAYCGSPEPLNFGGEIGEHGIIQGKVSKENTEIQFLPFSQRMFLEKKYRDKWKHELYWYFKFHKEMWWGKLNENFYKIILNGTIDRDINLDIDDLIRIVEMIIILK